MQQTTKSGFTTSGIVKLFTALVLMLSFTPYVYSQFIDFSFWGRESENPRGVHIYWFMENMNNNPASIKVWAAEGIINDNQSGDFIEIADIPMSDFEGDARNGYQYFLEYDFTENYYTMYLTAQYNNGTIKTSSWSYLKFGETRPEYLEFTSEPVAEARLNQEYYFDANAIYSQDENAEIVYSLNEAPDGMTIDSETGEVRWTPEESGSYYIWLHAELANDPNIFGDLYFEVYVWQCEVPAVIRGAIFTKNGDSVLSGMVELISADDNNIPFNKGYYAEITDGQFSFEVDEGSYYLIYSNENGFYQWYENARDINDATVIEAECGETTEIIMRLDFDTNFNYYNVSGTVEYDDGTPIEAASVIFEGFTDEPSRGRYNMYAITDADGHYEIRLPDNYKYIAYAISNQYNFWERPLYYNQTYNYDEATVIELTGDLDGINFVFDDEARIEYHTVSGTVKDVDGNPLEGVKIIFEGFSGDYNNYKPYFYNETLSDANGNYSIELPDYYKYIAYALSVQHNLFIPLYYNQTYNRDEAEKIALTGDLTGIDFTIEENPNINWFTVSGNVSYEDGSPAVQALVVFEGFTDDRDIYYGYNTFSVYTDANGNYSLRLPDIFKYIAYASDGRNPNGCWYPLYFDQTYNRDEAEIIQLTNDRSGINFVFGQRGGDYNTSISGIVVGANDEPLQNVYVSAFLVDGNQREKMYYNWGVITNENGKFILDMLMPGKYVLFAFPTDNTYSPGFYNEDGTASFDWENATRIELTDNQQVTGIKFVLGITEELVGASEVTGYVKVSENFVNEKAGKAVPGASIYLMGNNQKVNKFAQSNADGSFKLSRLASGNYTFVVDKVGYKKYTESITVDNEDYIDLGTIELVPETLSPVDDNNGMQNIYAYPNPAGSFVRINVTGLSQDAQISIVDAMGITIIKQNIRDNVNIIEIPTSGLAPGAYIVKVSSGTRNSVLPIIVNH